MKTTTCPICAYTLDDTNDEIIYCPVCGTDLIKVKDYKKFARHLYYGG